MSTLLTFRTGTGISSYVVHVSNDDRFPQTISTTTGTSWYVTTGATCWIDTIVYESGYSGARAKCSANGNDWSLSSDKYVGTSTTRNITVYATGGASASYKIKVVLGDGILQVSYRANSSSLGSNPNVASSDFTVDVGQGGYLYIGIARMDENYTYPVTASASSGTSSWTVVKADGTYNDQKISAPSSSGTRTVTLTATPDIKYYYKVHAFANGGYFSTASETDYYTLLYASRTISIDFDCSQLTTPKRGGYTFLGWGYSSNATQYYTDTITISATSQSSGSPTIYNVYAIWKKTEFTCHIKIGAGINSAAVYVDGALKSDIRDKVYHDISVSYDSTITVKSIAKASGYTKPYKFNFYQNSTATTPTSTMEDNTDEPSYAYSDKRFYAEIVATKSSIDLFYWNTAGTDAALFAKG